MNRTIQTEILKINGKSLVKIEKVDGYKRIVSQYAVVRGFDERKPVNQKWDRAVEYFLVGYGVSEEDALKGAMNCIMDVKKEPIPYARLSELATLFGHGLLEDDKDTAMEYFKETCEMSKEEMEYFGINDEKFELVEVTLLREVKTTIKILVPEGTSQLDYDDYIKNYDYLEIDEDDSDNWEIDSSDVIREDLTREDCSKYDDSEVWNADDYQ